MELPSFVKGVEADCRLNVVFTWGPWDGARLMADEPGRGVLVHRWSNSCPDSLEEYGSVREALQSFLFDEYPSVEDFLADRGGRRCDGFGTAVGYALDPAAVEALNQALSAE